MDVYPIRIKYSNTQKWFYSSWVHFNVFYSLIHIWQIIPIYNRDKASESYKFPEGYTGEMAFLEAMYFI